MSHPTKKDRIEFWESQKQAARQANNYVMIIGVMAIVGPIPLDWLVHRELFPTLLSIRAIMVPFLLITLWIGARYATTYRGICLAGGVAFAGSGIAIAIFVNLTGAYKGLYDGALSVVLLFGLLFRFPVRTALGAYTIILVAYFVPLVYLESGFADPKLIASSFFLLMTAVLSVVFIAVRDRIAYQDFLRSKELEERRRQTVELQRHKEEMFQNVSHELRTPLAILLSPLDSMLEDPGVPKRVKDSLAIMQRHGLNMLNLVNDLLEMAKLDTVPEETQGEPISIENLLRQIVDSAAPMAEVKKIQLDLRMRGTLVPYCINSSKLEKVILNLVSNALKFTPSLGEVVVSAWERENGAEICVRDTGCGIPKQAQATIFERFRQLDGSRTREYGGTGIGLSLAAKLVDSFGGKIELFSEEGEGTVVRVLVPGHLRAAPEVPVDSPSQSGLHRRAAYASLYIDSAPVPLPERTVMGARGPSVLIVEDDPHLRQQLVGLLSDQYRVTWASDGQQALDIILETPPHVVLSDIMMPNMDGFDLCAAIRRRPALKDVAVILLSARGELDDRVHGRKLGVDCYLTKPIHRKELMAAVEGGLRARMQLIGPYLICKEIGTGGQGAVFLAKHWKTEERVALKVVNRLTNEKQALRRLQWEQRALSKLNHPNVPKITGLGEEGDSFYVAMEYLPGETVLQRLTRIRGAMSVSEVVAVGQALCAAMMAVHEAGLIHGDLKCSNIMIVEGDAPLQTRVRLIDFGAVRQAALESSDGFVGTLSYLAPELLDGGEPTVETDIYALGVCLFVMLTGTLPYDRATREETKRAIRTAKTPHVVPHARNVPSALDATVFRAMDHDAQRRWSSFSQFGRALERIVLRPIAERPPQLAVVGSSFAEKDDIDPSVTKSVETIQDIGPR